MTDTDANVWSTGMPPLNEKFVTPPNVKSSCNYAPPLLLASAMAYSLLLLDKFSELKNIAHNYNVKETDGRMMKNKMRKKTHEDVTSLSFIDHQKLFYGMRVHKDHQTRTKKRACFKNWEPKIGVTGTTSSLKKCASVEPLGQNNTKKQKPVFDICQSFDFYLNGPAHYSIEEHSIQLCNWRLINRI
jgi:hypothetical protein